MPSAETLLVFAALSFGLAATPGPNMLYLVSRALAQGTGAGMVSLVGCQFGSLVIMLCAAAGLTAALFAVPYAWDALRLGGAAYLAFLAWQCVRPGGQPIFSPRPLPREPAARLFSVGFATAALNPKVALFYVAVLPPFIDPARGDVLTQGIVLGGVQIGVAILFDAALVHGAAGVARFLGTRPAWMAAQRWLLGAALGLIAMKLATEPSR
ncbi:LysE family translocator [Roseomonas alkaliterrae]|uniref:Threonine/homoserine/homoserine lactone efflux protein n=1 Tax=Neoroseomonas alkaliterrae TaxID=1452450 RepID=A0A840XK94_9PROT|nr:LysE family translocator [Neoroseomonas alkaliterrae]MBB5688958.1 threonine/homoserine/homoserine lactone efflux protein [Neoroseomonas alkaliterrae]MBR0674833.1 LysE family translocator [Neoroseomonas alkaliterrae]